MTFNTSLTELDERIAATLDALGRSRSLYHAEGISDEKLLGTLSDVEAQMTTLRASIARMVAAHAGTYEMIRYLNAALQMEYGDVIEYDRYVSGVDDAYLARKLQEFGTEMRQHCDALSRKITDLGGEPRFALGREERDDMTAFDLLSLRRSVTREVIAYYEKGLERFDDPEFRWLIGKIKVEEELHLAKLEELLDRYRGTAVMVKESEDFRWTDPYMGERGDRAWIE